MRGGPNGNGPWDRGRGPASYSNNPTVGTPGLIRSCTPMVRQTDLDKATRVAQADASPLGSEHGSEQITLSVVTPAYNEADGIEVTVRGWLEFLDQARWVERYEIVVGDDGSTDDTAAIVTSLTRAGNPVQIVQLGRNRGAGVALHAAIQATTLDWVLLMDSDGQFAIEDSERLFDAICISDADMAVGRRPAKRDRMILRLGSSASARLGAAAIGRGDLDINSAMKLSRGELIRSLPLEARHLNYSSDVLMKALESGASVVGADVGHSSRDFGESSALPLRDGLARMLFTAYSLIRAFAIRCGVLEVQMDRDRRPKDRPH